MIFSIYLDHGARKKGRVVENSSRIRMKDDYIGELRPDYTQYKYIFAPDRLIVHSTHILHTYYIVVVLVEYMQV